MGASGRDTRPAPRRDDVRWERVDDVRDEADKAVRRGRSAAPATKGSGGGRRPAGEGPRSKAAAKAPVRRGREPREASAGSGGAAAREELELALGKARGKRANERLRDAAHAFERDRYEEARTLLKPLAEQAPGALAVRELLGLTYYRLGRWKDAVRELEAFRELARTTEQHPVLADAHRALGHHRQVEELWEELREESPAPDLVTEGRIVMAGSLADRGKLAEAVSLLERSHQKVQRVQVHHLRQGYVLADLYERAGDVARARQLFGWVMDHDADFADAAERRAALG